MLKKLSNHKIFTMRARDPRGNVIREEDAAGRVWLREYDLLDRMVRETDPLGVVREWEYDAVGNLLRVRDPDGVSETDYDALDRVVVERNAMGEATKREYDAAGNLLREVMPEGQESRWEYDAGDRVIRSYDADGNMTETEYDRAGRQVLVRMPDSVQPQTMYDGAGRVVETTDGRNAYKMELDAVGRVKRTTDALGLVSQTEYLDEQREVRVRNGAGNLRVSRSNAEGMLDQLVDGRGGISEMSYSALLGMRERRDQRGVAEGWEHYGEDMAARPRISRVQRKSGAVLEREEDLMGRIIRDSGGGRERLYGYDNMGSLLDRENEVAAESFHYDAVDRVTEEGFRWKLAGSPGDYSQSYLYNANGWARRATGPGGDLRYDYTHRGQMYRVAEDSVFDISFSYDAGGHLKEAFLPGNLVMSYQMNAGRLSRIKASRNGEMVYSLDLKYDPRSNVRWSNEGGTLYGFEPGERVYDYDLANRLRGAAAGEVGSSLTEGYVYDAEGNRTASHQGSGWSYDAGQRLLESPAAVYAYDADGSRVSQQDKGTGAVVAYGYSAEGRINSNGGCFFLTGWDKAVSYTRLCVN